MKNPGDSLIEKEDLVVGVVGMVVFVVIVVIVMIVVMVMMVVIVMIVAGCRLRVDPFMLPPASAGG